jgi:predicted outer membrane repeat protein
MYFKMTRAAVTVAGGAAALCLGSVPAALAAPTPSTDFVPCNPYALHRAISDQSYGETLVLAPGCTYYLPDALPDITTTLTIVGYHSTLTRTRDAGSFSLLTVGGCTHILPSVASATFDDGNCGDLTVINVNFTDGGGYGISQGGAIDSDGTLTVKGGTFAGNKTDEYGGAIYADGQMTVSHGTFTGNLAPYGGAIFNDDQASIYVSSFTWNKAPPSTATPATPTAAPSTTTTTCTSPTAGSWPTAPAETEAPSTPKATCTPGTSRSPPTRPAPTAAASTTTKRRRCPAPPCSATSPTTATTYRAVSQHTATGPAQEP